MLFSHMRLVGKKLLILRGKKHIDALLFFSRFYHEIKCSFWGLGLFLSHLKTSPFPSLFLPQEKMKRHEVIANSQANIRPHFLEENCNHSIWEEERG